MDIDVLEIYGLIITIIVIILIGRIIQQKNIYKKMEEDHKNDLSKVRKDSVNRQRATIKGQVSEIIAPWLLESVNSVKELNFLGNPIDFIGFKGIDGKEEVEVKLIEIKTGKSGLTSKQKRIKEAIEANRVSWVEVRINEKDIKMHLDVSET